MISIQTKQGKRGGRGRREQTVTTAILQDIQRKFEEGGASDALINDISVLSFLCDEIDDGLHALHGPDCGLDLGCIPREEKRKMSFKLSSKEEEKRKGC